MLPRLFEGRLDLGSEQIEVQPIGIVRLEGMKAEPLPPSPRFLVQRGDHNGAAGRFLVELDGCGEDEAGYNLIRARRVGRRSLAGGDASLPASTFA